MTLFFLQQIKRMIYQIMCDLYSTWLRISLRPYSQVFHALHLQFTATDLTVPLTASGIFCILDRFHLLAWFFYLKNIGLYRHIFISFSFLQRIVHFVFCPDFLPLTRFKLKWGKKILLSHVISSSPLSIRW